MGYGDVVHMALFKAGAGNLHKLAVLLELVYCVAAAVCHTFLDTGDKLV